MNTSDTTTSLWRPARPRRLITADVAGQVVPLPGLYTRDVSLLGMAISRATVADLAVAAA